MTKPKKQPTLRVRVPKQRRFPVSSQKLQGAVEAVKYVETFEAPLEDLFRTLRYLRKILPADVDEKHRANLVEIERRLEITRWMLICG